MRVTSALGMLVSVALFALLGQQVRAAPLDAAACDAAMAEQGQMTDVPAIIERGPEWAKANIPAKDLKRVARWIELQEALSFRCGRGRVTADAQRAAAAAELLENPPPPPPKDRVVVNGAVKEGPAKEAAIAAKEAAVAAKEAAAAAKDAAKEAAIAAGASATQPVVDEAAKVKVAKPKPKPKPKNEPVEAAAPAADTGTAPPAPKKKAVKPADAFVPQQGTGAVAPN